MQLTPITDQSPSHFSLETPEQRVFLLINQSGDFSFELKKASAEAHIFALFTGKQDDTFHITLNQIHQAPHTTSSVTIAFLGEDHSQLHYSGRIAIKPTAPQSYATQKNTNLLLSNMSRAFSFPSLEICHDDVICHHGATTSQINPVHLFATQARGIAKKDATRMLADGFVRNFFLEIKKFGTFPEIEKYLTSL
jgi:Fe-S cluster assembly protein SufD